MVGKKWKELTEEQQNAFLKNANTVSGIDCSLVLAGECIVDSDCYYPLSVSGKVVNDEIVVEDDAIIYSSEG